MNNNISIYGLQTTTMNTATKDWLAANAGSNNCFVSSGISYTDADGHVQTNKRTGDVVNAFVSAHQVSKDTSVIIAGYSYTNLKTLNGNVDITLTDVQWSYLNDSGPGSTGQYCKQVIVCLDPIVNLVATKV